MDQRVEIHGTSRTDMNGKCGVATDFHPMGGRKDRSQDRYTVQLDSGEAFTVKKAECRAASPLGPEKLFELAERVRTKLTEAVGTDGEWPALSASQQEEMDGAIVMFQEAMDQVGRGTG